MEYQYTQKLIDFANRVQSEIEEVCPGYDMDMLDYLIDWGITNNMTEDEVIVDFDWRELTMELSIH